METLAKLVPNDRTRLLTVMLRNETRPAYRAKMIELVEMERKSQQDFNARCDRG